MNNSFVVFSIGTETFQYTSEVYETENLQDPGLLESYAEKLKNAHNAAEEISMDYDVLDMAIAQETFVSSDLGLGFCSGCQPESEGSEVEYYTSLEGWLSKLKSNTEDLSDRRVDINRILRFNSDPPSLEAIDEDGIVGRINEEFGVSIEVYVYSADEDILRGNSWDEDGRLDEGYLGDPDDDQWAFKPSFIKKLMKFL